MKIVAIILIVIMLFTSCAMPPEGAGTVPEGEELGREYYKINMKKEFEISDTLDAVPEGTGAKVIILIGQSNATGCSLTSYLKTGVGEEKYAEFEAGYDNVLINFFLDNGNNSSGGEFVPVDLGCGAKDGYFGPEVGMAEKISGALLDERVFILKFTMSGYSLNYHWLYDYEPSYIYESFKIFADTYLGYLSSKGYAPSLDAICWMQGESDTTDYKAGKYYDNTVSFVTQLRSDFADYAPERGIFFIDAGISSSPYCEPAYPEINEAKKRFSDDSVLNVYFPTIEAGLTTLYEPESEPDLGHYDALSELSLGRMFADEILGIWGIEG
ncbi:MAG: hypothetical protein IKC87_02770 [Clostridia bacterium]|nr:hypothetical protein [Clostridia bacterium]